MTIDERLEARTQTVELMAAVMRDNEKRWDDRLERLEQSVAKVNQVSQQDGENIRALARIAEMHERRPTDLEGGEQ